MRFGVLLLASYICAVGGLCCSFIAGRSLSPPTNPRVFLFVLPAIILALFSMVLAQESAHAKTFAAPEKRN